jgi:hypothetical protein
VGGSAVQRIFLGNVFVLEEADSAVEFMWMTPGLYIHDLYRDTTLVAPHAPKTNVRLLAPA